MTGFATLDGRRCTSVDVHVPYVGPWFADVDMEEAPDVSGRVSLKLGDLELSGTVRESRDGTHGLQRRTRVVAGAGGWGNLLTPKAYHNDSRIKARTLAEDAARGAGETLGGFAPELDRVGVHYVRQAGPASRVLEDVIGGVPWWVDYQGVTQVGERAESPADPEAYEVLEYHPRERLAVVAVDDLRQVGIGSVLSERLDDSQAVRELTVEVRDEGVRVHCWTGEGARGRLAGVFRSLVERATDGRIHGLWRYRVVKMSGDRVELQAMSQRAGLPDALPVHQFPGLAGAHADLTAGAEVLVQFVEGDRTRPVVTHYGGRGFGGHTPQVTTIDVATRLDLGAGASSFVALADKVDALVKAFINTPPVAQDGGAALQTAVDTAWSTIGESTEAEKVRAE
jgi:hypothetical protein